MQRRARYVLVGTGSRGAFFAQTLVQTLRRDVELVALCDRNPGRLHWLKQKIEADWRGRPTAIYADTQFDTMIAEQKPDGVIVTTMDCFHDLYIVRAMELGCDIVTEKPMTTDAARCRRIIDTVRRTGRNVRVTFNYRYAPVRTQVKDLLMKGTIGDILSVEFQWLLNTSHGADYFRRWHREKKNSGGLLVHKATHHFDLVNWWLAAEPEEVFAMGARRYYGGQSGMAERYGLLGHAERCHGCSCAPRCPFHLNLEQNPDMKALYLDCERHDGYFRDRCVFGGPMDIEDTMNVVVRYRTGAILSYALNAFMPWEGYHIAFNGTQGRLEHDCVESVYISGDGRVQGETIPRGTRIRIYPHFKPARNIPVRIGRGGHGGGDEPMLRAMFARRPPNDPYGRAADYTDGARSILVGIAANRSIQTGRPVKLSSLVKRLPPPRAALH